MSATGAACLLVHRDALEAVWRRAGPVWFDPIAPLSEDLSFCVRLADAGIATHVHTGVKTVHHKGGGYLDEQAYDAVRRSSPRG